jgi:hypothetical protein
MTILAAMNPCWAAPKPEMQPDKSTLGSCGIAKSATLSSICRRETIELRGKVTTVELLKRRGSEEVTVGQFLPR